MIKQITFILLMLLHCTFYVHAQAPNLINYQGVARNNAGNPVNNQNISIRLSIHDANATGIVQYSETRNVITDATGLFNLQIGSSGALNTTGSWTSITWDDGSKFLQVEMDMNGGTNFSNMGTQQLVSVPYAQHANKANGLIPSATITPAQLTSGGANLNDVLQFDGTNWVPGSASSGMLSLPFNVADPNLVSFGITNTSSLGGSAIYGKTTTSNLNASGIRGEASGGLGNGVYGKAASPNSYGVLGQNTTGVGVKGYATGANSIGVYGESIGSTGYGVIGLSNSTGTGIIGQSTYGTGVHGYTYSSGSAVLGESEYGTGVKSSSTFGYALETNGAVKIAGGNTNPSSGAVLTSDASGNAVWKNNKISFCARGVSTVTVPDILYTKVEFTSEDDDLQNNYNLYAGSTNSNSSTFIAPIAGIYSFSSALILFMNSSVYNFNNASIAIVKNGVAYAYANGLPKNSIASSSIFLDVDATMHLNVNDKVWIEVYQDNTAGNPQGFFYNANSNRFSGHLLFAD
ncbi:MAG TPA: hypothetical protein PLU17_07375 [Chitinophagaceae bacterium]|nr:hypothetical protein [Chitinophagaceae bacterium]